MTTRIRIDNPRDNTHSINVWKGNDHLAQVPPGDSFTCHIWEGSDVTIKEVANAAVST